MVLPIQVNETKSFEKCKIPQSNNVVALATTLIIVYCSNSQPAWARAHLWATRVLQLGLQIIGKTV